MFVGSFVFGLSDGICASSFWPKIRFIGITEIAVFGVIQTLMSLSRVFGLQVWKMTPWLESKKIPGISLILSSLAFFLFSYLNNSYLAVLAWLIRIFLLSAFFSTLQSNYIKIQGIKPYRATVLSFSSVLMSIGVVISTGILGIFQLSDVYINYILLFGGVAALIGGGIILKSSYELK